MTASSYLIASWCSEALALGVDLLEFVKATLAKIDERDGYKVRLRASPLICTCRWCMLHTGQPNKKPARGGLVAVSRRLNC